MRADWFKQREIFNLSLELTLDNYAHFYFNATQDTESKKLAMIEKVFNLDDCFAKGFKAIVFCKTRDDVDKVY